MIRPWLYLDPQDRETVQTIVAFLKKRLAEQGTIDWALKLKPRQRVERIAVEELLTSSGARNLAEPWASAWRLIEESWAAPHSEEHDGTGIYDIRNRLRSGNRSGAAVKAIVDLVAPRLKVEPVEAWRWAYIKRPRTPKTAKHILSASLTSGKLIDLNVLELASISDVDFLISLANALEAAVNHGLDTARRLGWDRQDRLWQLGGLGRVYYMANPSRTRENSDPDVHRHGIAPAVKLLYVVVSRICEM